MTLHMNIGQAASAAGVTPKMIRHYESLGLIPEAVRTDSGYRLYGERELEQLRFIRQSRALGFSIPQIESLLALWREDGRSSMEVKRVAQMQLEQLELRQKELDQMRHTLANLVAQCAGDDHAHCVILESLSTADTRSAPAPAARSLKEVKPGEKVAPKRAASKAPQVAERPHAALVAWSLGLGSAVA
jgi:Cu(I)-responsive transcriptional regulator